MSERKPTGPAEALPPRAEHVVSRPLGKQLILYNATSREVSVLNATAAVVWELCDGETPVAVAVERLRARFRIAPSRDVGADVAAVVRTLARRGLVCGPVPASAEDAPG